MRVGNVDVLAIPAKHEGRRLPTDPRLPTVGFVIGSRVAFYGDTDVFEEMSDLAGTLDVALLPVWGWGPRVGPGHMNPSRAARAAALIRPRIAVPIHWGTLMRPGVWWRTTPRCRRGSSASSSRNRRRRSRCRSSLLVSAWSCDARKRPRRSVVSWSPGDRPAAIRRTAGCQSTAT